MWLQSSQLEQIDSALKTRRAGEIDHLLADILREGAAEHIEPSACAACGRELVRAEPGPGLVIFTCPEEHGAWMKADALASLRGRLLEHSRHDRAIRFRVLGAVLGVLAATLFVGHVTGTLPSVIRWIQPMPAEERSYFQQLLPILDAGIQHRRDVEGVLQSKSEPDTYAVVYQIYHERQGDVLARLTALRVPRRLQTVHDHIVTATRQQIEFYGAFTAARMRDSSMDLARMLGHPALKTSDYELHAAWDAIRLMYPTLDAAASQRIESALCQFDLI